MTTPSASEAKDLLLLAERMGIPVDEAMRQLARVIAGAEDPIVEDPAAEQTIVLSAEPEPAAEPVVEPEPVSNPASASIS
jgi:hypothetical protein